MIYTTQLIVIPNYAVVTARQRLDSSLNSSYCFQSERFRSTLIVLPYDNRKRFIQGIEVRCGSFTSNSSAKTPSDVCSGDESICEYRPQPAIGHSYFDLRHRLLMKSNRLTSTMRDDTDVDDNDSFDGLSSIGNTYDHDPNLRISAYL